MFSIMSERYAAHYNASLCAQKFKVQLNEWLHYCMFQRVTERDGEATEGDLASADSFGSYRSQELHQVCCLGAMVPHIWATVFLRLLAGNRIRCREASTWTSACTFSSFIHCTLMLAFNIFFVNQYLIGIFEEDINSYFTLYVCILLRLKF